MHQHGSSNQSQPVGKASLQENRQPTRLSLPIKLVLYVSIGIIAFFLITEHLAHLVGFFPLLSILFICMFMHLFMHGGHGGHGDGNSGNSPSR
ncbi:hypothetical protein C7B69_22635 [filamentous cyanobacterium Phorm 46]|nr:hypothetical protein C7B69_22635 [filamentous cyanobacterium Phorm 46]PSB40705.1 hypothetical protein C7B67_27775 [filamentous cyanobacterium Phorm 6]